MIIFIKTFFFFKRKMKKIYTPIFSLNLIKITLNEEIKEKITCYDENCLVCGTEFKHSCIECSKNYILHLGDCGKNEKCNIKNCELCSFENICIKCKSCVTSSGKCSCIERIIIYVSCGIISCLIIGIVLYCLIHPVKSSINFNKNPTIYREMVRRNRLINTIQNYNYENFNNNVISNFNFGNNFTKNISDEFLKEEFEKNKIDINGIIIENKKCDNCLNNLCNVKLNCGCFICFDCLKKEEINKICPKCKKSINNIQQITCSICFGNKNEISKFKCNCSLVVCLECYIKWKKENDFCPACRNKI